MHLEVPIRARRKLQEGALASNVTYSREDSTISATLPLAVIGLRVITVVMIGRALAEAVVEVGIAIAV